MPVVIFDALKRACGRVSALGVLRIRSRYDADGSARLFRSRSAMRGATSVTIGTSSQILPADTL